MSDHEAPGKGRFALNNTVYDVAKDATMLYIPALAVLYATLAGVWGWGYVTEISLTAAGIVTFLGVVLKISTTSFNNSIDKGKDGTLTIDFSNPAAETVVADVTTPFIDAQGKKNIVLKVVDKTRPSQ
jgi:hypothetical protein